MILRSAVLLALACLSVFSSCSMRAKKDKPLLVSVNIVDPNGFTETVSAKERLDQFERVDFLQSQPYKKVMRVYSRDKQGKTRSVLTSYYPNGQVKQYLEVVNGRAFGTYREWHESGNLKLEATVIGGKADLDPVSVDSWLFDGMSRAWSEGGEVLAQLDYRKGQQEGIATYFYSNGTVWKSIPYEKGKLEGVAENFFPNGDLQIQSSYREGNLEGLCRRFWKKDQIASSEEYRAGMLLDGKYYDQKGILIAEVNAGKGIQAMFLDDGSVEMRSIIDGIQQGKVKLIDPCGRLMREYGISAQAKHGEEIFYTNQKPRLSLQWYHGAIQGTATTWYENGMLESQREMSHNKRNGVSTAWYRDGSLMLIEEYRDDKLIKGEYYEKGSSSPFTKVVNGKGMAALFDGDGLLIKKVRYEDGSPDE